VLTGIGCIASFTEGQIPSGVLTLAMTLQTGTVVVLLLVKRADRTLETLDKWCSVGAVVGLILWPVFNSPTVTIVAMITIDIVGAVPTVRNAWQYPHEEKWVTFLLTGLASAAALVAVGSWEISALAYPLYLLLLYTTLVLVILTSQRRSNSKDTATADLLQ
jgi:hypothetical protein